MGKFQKNKTIILVALPAELPADRLIGWDIAYVGVGKVNAAINGAKALQKCEVDTVINYGTAGAVRPGISGLCEVTSFFQRDMDARPLGFPLGETPFEAGTEIDLGRPGYTIGTGDSFAERTPELVTDLVDMEAYSLAKLAASFGKHFFCFKFVSDQADKNAAADWDMSVGIGADLFVEHLTKFSH